MIKRLMRLGAAVAAAAGCGLAAMAGGAGQPTANSPLAPPPNSVRKVDPGEGWHALVGATVHTAPGRSIQRATVVLRAGRIVSIQADGAAPAGAQAHDCAGLHVYAGFIEPYLEVDVPRPDSSAPGSHWNPRVTPQRSALDKGSRGIDTRTADSLRDLGFTAAAISPRGGIFRGQGAVVSLARPSGDPSQVAPRVYRDGAYQAMGLEGGLGGAGGGDALTEPRAEEARWETYPGSQMGAIALIRQTLSDADWQATWEPAAGAGGVRAPNALDAIGVNQNPPRGGSADGGGRPALMLFDVGDPLEALRAAKIGREFKRPVAILGSGREYQRLAPIVEDGVALVLPLNFPRPPEVATIGEANAAELEELMHWEQAPTNPRRVMAALTAAGRGDAASLTTSKGDVRGRGGRGGGRRGAAGGSGAGESAAGAGGREAFAERLSSAIKHGLSAEQALAMLTVNPAKLLGVDQLMGTVEEGKAANLVVADGPLFTDRPDAPKKGEPGYLRSGRIVEVWADGVRHTVRERPEVTLAGHYELTFDPPLPEGLRVTMDFTDDEPAELTITKITRDATGHEDTVDIKVREFDRSGPALSRFTFSFEHEPFGEKGVFLNSGTIGREKDGTVVLHGDYVRASGTRMSWRARRTGDAPPRKMSLAGAWPVVFDEPPGAGKASPVILFDRGNVATVQPPPGVRIEGAQPRGEPGGPAAAGRGGGGRGSDGAPVEDFEYDGRMVTFEVASAAVGAGEGDGGGGEGAARVEATVDFTAVPPKMSGTIKGPDGRNLAWTARRRESNPFAGEWRVTQAAGQAMPADGSRGLLIRISGRRDRVSVELEFTEKGRPTTIIAADDEALRIGKVFFTHDLAKLGGEGRSSDEVGVIWGREGPAGDVLVGLGRLPDGTVHPYEAKRTPESIGGEKREAAAIAAIPEKLGLPFGPYQRLDAAPQERVLITSATIWTCQDGTTDTQIRDGAVVIADGKISYVGPSASVPRLAGEFVTIDAAGKYVAPGIVDCHSHTGISRGVNEAGQAVTAEVRIGDVTNPDDVSWYRQLAGGVTSVNNLHGSANAIGGQSMVNKIRWGCLRPDDMHFEGDDAALPGIKFALGENPKQSNWGDRNTTRYPQTRMGVEMLIRDRFVAAREYLKDLNRVKDRGGSPPRRDLELEAMAEILEGKRLVHCHSYRQDEILMLCRVAEEFGFKIGTFQHILEGYKVADEMVKWSGGGSAFSDWWAYKLEVQDAIPGAGPLMAEQGVTVSFNSDSDEMARRMNVEAGKASKYSRLNKGGPIPPHEAYKFVTLNAARQVRAAARIGSLEAGKDADVAIWSGVPTSPTSRCEATWVDGRRLFSLEQDAAQRKWIASERARLVQKVLASRPGRAGGRGQDAPDDDPPTEDEDSELHGDQPAARADGRRLMIMDALQRGADLRADIYLNMLLRGLDPRWMRAGDCGCEMTGGEQ